MGNKGPINEAIAEARRQRYSEGKIFLRDGYYTLDELRAFAVFMVKIERYNRKMARKK